MKKLTYDKFVQVLSLIPSSSYPKLEYTESYKSQLSKLHSSTNSDTVIAKIIHPASNTHTYCARVKYSEYGLISCDELYVDEAVSNLHREQFTDTITDTIKNSVSMIELDLIGADVISSSMKELRLRYPSMYNMYASCKMHNNRNNPVAALVYDSEERSNVFKYSSLKLGLKFLINAAKEFSRNRNSISSESFETYLLLYGMTLMSNVIYRSMIYAKSGVKSRSRVLDSLSLSRIRKLFSNDILADKLKSSASDIDSYLDETEVDSNTKVLTGTASLKTTTVLVEGSDIDKFIKKVLSSDDRSLVIEVTSDTDDYNFFKHSLDYYNRVFLNHDPNTEDVLDDSSQDGDTSSSGTPGSGGGSGSSQSSESGESQDTAPDTSNDSSDSQSSQSPETAPTDSSSDAPPVGSSDLDSSSSDSGSEEEGSQDSPSGSAPSQSTTVDDEQSPSEDSPSPSGSTGSADSSDDNKSSSNNSTSSSRSDKSLGSQIGNTSDSTSSGGSGASSSETSQEDADDRGTDNSDSDNSPDSTDPYDSLVNDTYDSAKEESPEDPPADMSKFDSKSLHDTVSKFNKENYARQKDPDPTAINTQELIDSTSGSGKVAKGWRSSIRQIIETANGVKVRYLPDAPNARIEGQFGRESVESVLKDLVISIDLSGSMNVASYKAALKYLEDLAKLKLGFDRVSVVYWSDRVLSALKPKKMSVRKLYSYVNTHSPRSNGGTEVLYSFTPFVSGSLRSVRPDLFVVFTDGYVFDQKLDPKIMSWYRKYKKKIIFVVTPDGTRGRLKDLFKGCNIIKMTDNIATKG